MLLLLTENDKEAFLEISWVFLGFFCIVSIKRKLQDILYISKFMAPATMIFLHRRNTFGASS